MCVCVNFSDRQDCKNAPGAIGLGQALARAHVYRSIGGRHYLPVKGRGGYFREGKGVKYFSRKHLANSSSGELY